MNTAFKLLGICVASGLACTARPMRAQTQARALAPSAAVRAVIEYRRLFLNDSSRLDACSLERALGGQVSPAALGAIATGMIAPNSGCQAVAAGAGRGIPVHVISVGPADSVVSVKLAVQHGEYFHVETFSVRKADDRTWVDSVTLSGGTIQDLVQPGKRP